MNLPAERIESYFAKGKKVFPGIESGYISLQKICPPAQKKYYKTLTFRSLLCIIKLSVGVFILNYKVTEVMMMIRFIILWGSEYYEIL